MKLARTLKAPVVALARSAVRVLSRFVDDQEQRRVADAPVLIGHCQSTVRWRKNGKVVDEEIITFFLFETVAGKRSWKVHEYGYCAAYESHKERLAPILFWKHGGCLPNTFVPVRAGTSPLRRQAAPEQPRQTGKPALTVVK